MPIRRIHASPRISPYRVPPFNKVSRSMPIRRIHVTSRISPYRVPPFNNVSSSMPIRRIHVSASELGVQLSSTVRLFYYLPQCQRLTVYSIVSNPVKFDCKRPVPKNAATWFCFTCRHL
jgi:hypothetical protein